MAPAALRHAQADRAYHRPRLLFEIQPTFGKALITGLARMNGKVVGVIANNPMIYGGAMDVKAARKQIHFVEMCDCFHMLRAIASPFRTAEAFGVEEIIDPRETRPYLRRFIDAAQARLKITLGPKPKYGVRP